MFERAIAEQFKKPRGLLGQFAANFMKKNNHKQYGNVVEMLDIQDDDRILEIGCGAGYAIQLIVNKNEKCCIDGVDFSRLMVKKAYKNNSGAINNGRVTIDCKDLRQFKEDGRYSKVFAINVIYFWDDLNVFFSKIFSLLKENGRVVLYMTSSKGLQMNPAARVDTFNKYELDYVTGKLSENGFSNITHEMVLRNDIETYYITAEKITR